MFVQHVSLQVGDGSANGHFGQRRAIGLVQGGDDGGFGRAVGVKPADSRPGDCLPASQIVGGGLLAADDHQPQTGRYRRQFDSPGLPVSSGQVEHGKLLGFDEVGQFGRRGQKAFGAQHQAGAAGPGGEYFLDGGVEVDGGKLQNAVSGAQIEGLHDSQVVVDNRAMGNHYAFGLAGGAGSVDDVGQVVGRDVAVYSETSTLSGGPVLFRPVVEGCGGHEGGRIPFGFAQGRLRLRSAQDAGICIKANGRCAVRRQEVE